MISYMSEKIVSMQLMKWVYEYEKHDMAWIVYIVMYEAITVNHVQYNIVSITMLLNAVYYAIFSIVVGNSV